jgi:hypothetical protein
LKPLITGVVLAMIALAIIFVVPVFLPRATDPTTLDAMKKSELARRQLHSYDSTLPLAADRSDLERLKTADLGPLAEKTAEDYAPVQTEFNRGIQGAKKLDQRSGLTGSELRPVAPGAGAVGGFEKGVRDNEKLLKDAVQNARQATQEDRDRNALSAGQIAGTTKLVEANNVLVEARSLRTALATELDRLLNDAVHWAEIQSLNEHYAGLDLTDVEKTLGDDLSEIGARMQETSGELQTVESTLAATKKSLEETRAQLQIQQAKLADLEKKGFVAGKATAFETYRAEYVKLSNDLRGLQLREQTLTHGGIEGGTVTGDDLVAGEFQGGKIVAGIDELERKAAILRVKLERLGQAKQTLESQRTLVAGLTSESKTQRTSCGEKLLAAKAEFDQARVRVDEAAKLAFEKEDATLQAAKDAVAGFKTAKSAADQWKTKATSTQRDYDAPRLNERLKLIIADESAATAASSGEAQATALVGRVLAERTLALGGYLDVVARVKALMPSADLDPTALQESYTQAHDTAIENLNAAREMYERLAQKQVPTQWVPQASLATIYHLLWQIDATNAAQHRGNLLDLLGRVVQGRQQFPYIQQEVLLYSALGGSGAPASQPATEPPAEKPAEPQAPADEG